MSCDQPQLDITPETKVGELLERYPHLEEVLINLSPTYKALKNPVLRRTVAKVATLHQVSKVGNIPIGRLVESLRSAAGQGGGPILDDPTLDEDATLPAWVKSEAVARSLDAREMIQAGSHPMPQVMRDLGALNQGEWYELVTPFVPAPLIELAAQKGFEAWSSREGDETVRTWFRHSGE
jgi:uncharacterized protein (DUF2249 family)